MGAKGGFYPKRLPAGGSREDVQKEVIASYQTFIRGLLDVTDNIVNGKTVAASNVVRRDGDDAYLVVAADKGTATFSDIANAISIEYGHWLGDAFASGGSAGYDHKGMGITARGAWECVKRHFREIGVDIQSQEFTCAGIGDMSGDVFGNGMLLSKHIRARRGVRSPAHLPRPESATPRRAFASASACSSCRDRAGTTIRASSSRAAAACGRAPPSRFRCRPRRGRCSTSTSPAATPVGSHARHPAHARSTCCGTAASAPT